MVRICSKWVSRLARHRIIAQKGPEIPTTPLDCGGYAEKALESMGRHCCDGFRIMPGDRSNEHPKASCSCKGDIYKMAASSKYETYPHHHHQHIQKHHLTTTIHPVKHLQLNRFNQTHLQQTNQDPSHSRWSPNQTASRTATATPMATPPTPSAST